MPTPIGPILARLPEIPHPPYRGTFASVSSFALLGLLHTNTVPRHPLFIVAWACSSFYVRSLWVSLKAIQLVAQIEDAVDTCMKEAGACEDCRKQVMTTGGGQEMSQLLTDLKKANSRAENEAGAGTMEGP